MENYQLNDVIKKSSNAAWALGGLGVVYMIVSLWIADIAYKVFGG